MARPNARLYSGVSSTIDEKVLRVRKSWRQTFYQAGSTGVSTFLRISVDTPLLPSNIAQVVRADVYVLTIGPCPLFFHEGLAVHVS